MAAMDPFRAVQDDVNGTFTDIQNELAKWRKLPSKSPKVEPGRQRILSSLSELQVDLQDMQATIDIALRDPTKFALTPSELMTRQDFVRDLQAQVNDAREALEGPSQPASRSLSAQAATQRVDRQTLLTSSTRASDELAPSSSSRHESSAWQDNENACVAHQQQLEQSYDQQEAELGTIGRSLDRLGNMGRVMNDELRAQGRELEAFTEEVGRPPRGLPRPSGPEGGVRARACGCTGPSLRAPTC